MTKKMISLRTFIITILCTTIISSTGIMIILASNSNTFTISEGIYPSIPSYTIWRSGSSYYAKDQYGLIPTWGSSINASIVIQGAIDDTLQTGGGKIFFKSATYELTASLTYSMSAGQKYIELEGENMWSTSLYGASLSDYALKLLGDFGMISIRNLRIDGGVYVGAHSNYLFDHVYFQNGGGTKYNLYCVDSHIVRMSQCSIAYGDNGGMLVQGNQSDPSDYIISDCIFYGSNNFQLKMEGLSANHMVRDFTISSCYFEPYYTTAGHGIVLNYTNHGRIIGNTFAGSIGNNFNLVHITGGSDALSTTKFKFVGNDVWAYTYFNTSCYIEYAKNGIISDNTFSSSSASKHQFYESSLADDNIVSNNQFTYGLVSILGNNTIIDNNYGYP